MKQVRLNISAVVNASKIRREKRDGRDVIIVPSATMPDGIVMNRTRYSADENDGFDEFLAERADRARQMAEDAATQTIPGDQQP